MKFVWKRTAALLCGLAVATAAETGMAGALEEAILDYRLGLYEEAFARMDKLARASNPKAMFWIGTMWHKGQGTDQDYRKAQQYYLSAAELGDPDAQNNLGLLYRDGLGTSRDPVMAYSWFTLAASDGHTIARRNREDLGFFITPEEKRQAGEQTVSLKKQILAARSVYFDNLSTTSSVAGPLAEQASKGLTPSTDERALSTAPDSARKPQSSQSDDGAPNITSTPADVRGKQPTAGATLLATKVSVSVTGFPEAADARLREQPSKREGIEGAEASPDPRYMVQLGLFENQNNIRVIYQRMADTGLVLRDENVRIGDRQYRRLRIGEFRTLAEAKRVESEMNSLFRIRSLIIRLSY